MTFLWKRYNNEVINSITVLNTSCQFRQAKLQPKLVKNEVASWLHLLWNVHEKCNNHYFGKKETYTVDKINFLQLKFV